MAREPGGEREASPSNEASPASSAGGVSASASSDPGTPGNPRQVPIDDHVYWLAIAGLLLGVWRLRGG